MSPFIQIIGKILARSITSVRKRVKQRKILHDFDQSLLLGPSATVVNQDEVFSIDFII